MGLNSLHFRETREKLTVEFFDGRNYDKWVWNPETETVTRNGLRWPTPAPVRSWESFAQYVHNVYEFRA